MNPESKNFSLDKLNPPDDDIIIIESHDSNYILAELAEKRQFYIHWKIMTNILMS